MHECLLWENKINSNKIYQERHEKIYVMKKVERYLKGYNFVVYENSKLWHLMVPKNN